KVLDEGGVRIEEDLTAPGLRELFEGHPEQFIGFTESDQPNGSFNSSACTFESGTLALAEEALRNQGEGYIWRFRLPFNENEDPCNFVSRLQNCGQIHDGINSLSQVDDCVGACLELWERHAPFGIYNVVNPGAMTTREIIQMIWRVLGPRHGLQPRVGHNGSNGGPEPDCILEPAS